jgi:hypothetical protein
MNESEMCIEARRECEEGEEKRGRWEGLTRVCIC